MSNKAANIIDGVYITTPMHDRPVFDYLMSFAKTLDHLRDIGLPYKYNFGMHSSNLPLTRNILVHEFLHYSNLSRLLFVDSDMSWKAEDVVKLVNSKSGFVSGACTNRKIPLRFCFKPHLRENGKMWRLPKQNLLEVTDAGTGFLCIHRKIFEYIRSQEPENYYYFTLSNGKEEKIHRFFDFSVTEKNKPEGEDFHFSRKARKYGIKAYVDYSCIIGHIGNYCYSGDPTELFGNVVKDQLPLKEKVANADKQAELNSYNIHA